MKLCKDCKWMRRDIPFFWVDKFARCKAPQSYVTVSLVSGKKRQEYTFADIQRRGASDCGAAATWFEPKASVRTAEQGR